MVALIMIWYCVVAALFVGWVLNIIQIVSTEPFALTGLMVLKIVGVFIAPLGGVMGYI